MVKHEIIALVIKNHQAFAIKVNELSDNDFIKVPKGKWTAGQQLDHILKSVKAITRAFEVPKFILENKFGVSTKPSRDYERVVNDYLITLEQNPNYKLEKRFTPEEISLKEKNGKLRELENIVCILEKGIEKYSEDDLDTYVLPHPVMGRLTLREVLYFTAYHVVHHDKQISQNLNNGN